MGPSQGQAPDHRRGRPHREQGHSDPVVPQGQQGDDKVLAHRQSE
jgi:hypothetical protein